jgi:hypothetical protein
VKSAINRRGSFGVLQTGISMGKILGGVKKKTLPESGLYVMRGFSINNLWNEITCVKEDIFAAIVITNHYNVNKNHAGRNN